MEYPQPHKDRKPWMSERDRNLILTLLMLKPYRMRVLEYGAGWSTVFFSRYAGKWNAVEHDANWLTQIRDHLPSNVGIYHAPQDCEAYIKYAMADMVEPGILRPIDLVFIDGRRREDCANEVLRGGENLSWITLMHDARRGSAAMRKFPHHFKIGDDLYLGMFEKPRFDTIFRDFEARHVDELSVPWDASHIGQPGFTAQTPG